MRRFGVGLLVLVSALLLVLSSTSLWTRHNVVNTDVFVANGQRIITDPTVSARVETQVVDTIMAKPEVQQAIDQAVSVLPPRLQVFRPSVEEGTRNLLSRGVQLILTSPQFAGLTGAALRTAQTQILNGEPVGLTLGQAKARIPAEDRTGLAGQVIDLIPDDVGFTVLTPQQAPGVYTALNLLKSLWLWVGLISLGILVGALALSRQRMRTLRAWAVTTGVIALLLVLSLGLIRGPLLGEVKPANAEAANAVYQGITASLRSWTLWLVLIMAGITAFTLLWGRTGIVRAVRRGYDAARAKAEQRWTARAAAASMAGVEGEAAEPTRSWPTRIADESRAFVDGMNLPERLAGLAAFLRRNLRAVRWAGIAVGALVLLLWPAPSLSVFIWVVACVALYIGLIELVLAVGARSETAADEETSQIPVATNGGVTAGGDADSSAVLPPPAARSGVGATNDGAKNDAAPGEAGEAAQATVAKPPANQPMTPEGISAMSSKLDLLMRLGDARTAGVLTDEEFTSQKTQLLTS
ncbi:SHOCT domain-containing protein [Pseudonocardia alaniniphila]|uniref:SHOCT domain-containing protein n=1 Tax=Pseudonocardia alaniniphila TaxID=75291 RepID=A0ABS9TSH9_9PSEU|nr:hypothetical protein [Pseudonocardia alaniniphila]MCH6171466.1 hypothetical protein [Pseudonocardia alaniniphila]